MDIGNKDSYLRIKPSEWCDKLILQLHAFCKFEVSIERTNLKYELSVIVNVLLPDMHRLMKTATFCLNKQS